MSSPEEMSLNHILQVILAAAFGAWAWVVKTAANRHLDSQDSINQKVDRIMERIVKLEIKMRLHHKDTHETED